MPGCVSPQALLSALVSRAAREGYVPTREELATLVSLGCTREEIVGRFTEAPAVVGEVRARLP